MASKIWSAVTSTDWNVAANWTPAGVPVNGDDVYIDGTVSSQPIDSSLDQSAVTLASLTVIDTYGGTIGTASAYLKIGATVVMLGVVSQGRTRSNGSGRLKFDFGTVQTGVTVYSSGQATADANLDPIRVLGTNANNSLTVLAGRVGVATTSRIETATFANVSLSSGDCYVTTGPGVTLGTAVNNGGTLTTNAGATSITLISGTLTTYGKGTIGTLEAGGGQLNLWHRTGAQDVGTFILNGAAVNTKGAPANVTIGATSFRRGGSVSVFSKTQVSWGTATFDATNVTNLTMQLD